MKPLLAQTYEPHRVSFPCWVQPKLNGVRALYQGGRFQSRDEIPWSPDMLSHISRELVEVFGPETILDGELYVHGWSLQRINGAITPVRKSEKFDTALVEYHIFDRVDFTKSFADRWASLPHGVQFGKIHFVDTVQASTTQLANNLYAHWVSQGYEGMMYRLGDCPYTRPRQTTWIRSLVQLPPPGRLKYWSDKDNRTWHLLKRKDWKDEDYLIESIERTCGDKGEPGFQLHCRTPAGKPFKLGTGLSQAEVEYYLENSPAGKKVKAKFLCLSDEGIPLNATILAIL